MITKQETGLTQELNLDNGGEHLIAAVAPSIRMDLVNNHANLCAAALARATRRRWPLFVLCVLAAIGVGAISHVIPSGGILEGMATTVLLLGLLSLLMTRVRYTPTAIQAFEEYCNKTVEVWARSATEQATTLSKRWQSQAAAWTRQRLLAASPAQVLAEVRECLQAVQALNRRFEASFTAAAQAVEKENTAVATALSGLRAQTARWTRGFRLGAIRRLAHDALTSCERSMKCQRDRIVIDAIRGKALAPLAQALDAMANRLMTTEHECADMANEGDNAAESDGFSGQHLDGATLWPPATNIRKSVQDALTDRLPNLRAEIISQLADVSAAEAISKSVDQAIGSDPILADDFRVHFGRMDGQGKALLGHGLAVSRQWSHFIDHHPGDQHWQITCLMCADGEASPIYKQLAKQAHGMVVRGLPTDRPGDLLLLTQSRYERPSSHPALGKFALALRDIKPAELGAMTPLEDVEFLTQYTPELADPHDLVLTTLALALVIGLVVRDSAVLRLAPGHERIGNLPDGRLGRGWDQAVTTLKTNSELLQQLDAEIKNVRDVRGAKAVAGLITTALAKPNFAPDAQQNTVTRLLMAERDRLAEL